MTASYCYRCGRQLDGSARLVGSCAGCGSYVSNAGDDDRRLYALTHEFLGRRPPFWRRLLAGALRAAGSERWAHRLHPIYPPGHPERPTR